jgi:hypothetical protein
MRVAATWPVSSAPVLAALALLLIGSASLATGAMAGHVLGGKTDTPAAANSLETDGLARFAVDEHNKRQVTRSTSSPSLPPSLAVYFDELEIDCGSDL